jgi:hypothetical protein
MRARKPFRKLSNDCYVIHVPSHFDNHGSSYERLAAYYCPTPYIRALLIRRNVENTGELDDISLDFLPKP